MTASLHGLGCGRDAGQYYLNDPNRESRKRGEYYSRDGGGTWWSTRGTIVRHGAVIDKETFRDLCAGLDPRTGKPLVRAAGAGHRAGWDMTFSSPKSLSLLWMAGDDEQRSTILELHRAAVNDALKFLLQEQLVEVRLGQGGYIREAPADVIVGLFDHFTSREGDASIHTHSVILNVAGCKESVKKYRTLSPERLFDYQLAVGAAFRASLASRLMQIGFVLRRVGRGQFEIAGIPEDLIEKFSKRSRQIEERVGRDASGAQKELAALATRSSKNEVPTGEALEQRWREELAETGVDPWKAARSFVPDRDVDRNVDHDLDPPEVPGMGPIAIAASALFRHESVINREELLRDALIEATFTGVGIERVWADLELDEERGILCKLAGNERAECWTTPSIANVEASLLRAADRQNEHDWFQSDAVEAAIRDASFLSDEQMQAVRFSANRDGVVVCNSAAGSGKTTLACTIVEAARRSGLSKIYGLSPTWVGADELSKSCAIETFAIAKWRHDTLAGARSDINAKTLIIIDEAGASGLRELEFVLRLAQEKHVKVVCLGDTRQLEPVQNGSALRSVMDVVGRGAVLSQVRRQEVEWQRAASVVMAHGDSEAGLRAYSKSGRVELVSGEAEAQARVIQSWNAYRQVHGDDVLIITRRNVDATALNEAARAVLRSAGRLLGPDLSLPCVGRDKKIGSIELAKGDRIRFGENLHSFRIRNGTLGTIEHIGLDHNVPKIAVRLDDSRLIEAEWASLTRGQLGRLPNPPRISSAYAGTAYSVQGRTSAAAVLYIAKPTDSRETYVGLTRHKVDGLVVVERDRLLADVRKRQTDVRSLPSETAIRERLFTEARSYTEKANVADYVADRINFMRTGQIVIQKPKRSLNLAHVARTAQRLREAAREMSTDRSLVLPAWRLVESVRQVQRKVSQRVAEIIHAIRARIELRTTERVVTQDRDMSR